TTLSQGVIPVPAPTGGGSAGRPGQPQRTPSAVTPASQNGPVANSPPGDAGHAPAPAGPVSEDEDDIDDIPAPDLTLATQMVQPATAVAEPAPQELHPAAIAAEVVAVVTVTEPPVKDGPTPPPAPTADHQPPRENELLPVLREGLASSTAGDERPSPIA